MRSERLGRAGRTIGKNDRKDWGDQIELLMRRKTGTIRLSCRSEGNLERCVRGGKTGMMRSRRIELSMRTSANESDWILLRER